MPKLITYIAITIFLVSRASAQDAPEIFKHGLYTEEVIGDLTEAIAIYNRVLSLPVTRHVAGDAMVRLMRPGLMAKSCNMNVDHPHEKSMVAPSSPYSLGFYPVSNWTPKKSRCVYIDPFFFTSKHLFLL